MIKYLKDYSAEESWGDDRESFQNLVTRFTQLHALKNEKFYILNVDWFFDSSHKFGIVEGRDPRLNELYWCYSFFFVLIWIDTEQQTLTVTEWFYD